MKVRFWCCTHDLGSKAEDIQEVDSDLTDEELEKWAEEYFWEQKQPEWGFEKIEE